MAAKNLLGWFDKYRPLLIEAHHSFKQQQFGVDFVGFLADKIELFFIAVISYL